MALELLDQARATAGRWLDPADAEALHDFRVAIRRLRSTLRAWRAELEGSVRGKDRRKLREIQAATGEGRDAEVGLAWLGKHAESADSAHFAGREWIVQRLEQRLAQSWTRARKGVKQDFDALEQRLRARLEFMRVDVNLAHPAPGERFGDALAARLREHAQDLVQRLAEVTSPSNRDQAHAARIRLKRLRYLAEPAEGCVPGVKELIANCKRLQDLLGGLNDAHVLGAEIDAALDGLTEHERAAPQALAHSGLVELALRVEAQREELFVKLEREWLGDGKALLGSNALAIALATEIAARAGTEIERKYLLRGLPPLPQESTSHEIEQGWLPGKVLRERVRRVRDAHGTRYFRTVKLGRGVIRTEIEEETTREIFEALWPLTAGCRVHKHRTKVVDGDFLWEIDEFMGRELHLAEVELRDAAVAVVVPAWLAPWIVREVSDEAGFTNLELATP